MIINLWSGPRNVSTALMYSFANRGDCKVIDEPFYAHFLVETDADHPGREEVLDSQSSDVDEILMEIGREEEEHGLVFIKNMGHHSEGLDLSAFDDMKNIFLLREPSQMLSSLVNLVSHPILRDTAYKYQLDIMNRAISAGQQPLVIDSKALLHDPEMVLNSLCEKLGIPFTNKMLKWEKGPIKEDGVWAKYWYKNVHKSEGFKPYVEKQEEVPVEFEELLDECNKYYNKLIEYAV